MILQGAIRRIAYLRAALALAAAGRRRDLPAMQAAVQRLRTADPGDTLGLSSLAVLTEERHDRESAVPIWEEVLSIDATDVQALRRIAEHRARRGDPEMACEAIRRAISADQRISSRRSTADTAMNALSSYTEKRFGGPRQYSLFPDHLLVSGSETFRSEFEVKVPLATLHPDYSRARVRNHLFGFGLLLMLVGGVGVLQRLSSPAGIHYEDFWSILWIAALLSGLIVCGSTWQKVPHVIFVNESGQGIVGLIEREDAQFRSFVQTLSDQIVIAKRDARQR